MFSLDHHNYARWSPVHIREMSTLHHNHPKLYEEFFKGTFAVQKTNQKFSEIGLNHNHEQMNSKIKGIGRAIGLTENDQALWRWLISGPEIAQLFEEFESVLDSEVVEVAEHHDSSISTQTHFLKEVKLMLSAVIKLGNPFLDDGSDLYALDTKEVVYQNAASALRQVQDIGVKQFEDYLEARFWAQVTPITDTISKNNICVFTKVKSQQTM